MVEPLGALLLDSAAWDAPDGSAESWGPIHALYLLGGIGSAAALPALLEAVRQDLASEFLLEDLPAILGRLGPVAVEPIVAYLVDESPEALYAGTVALGLVRIGYLHPECRDRISGILAGLVADDTNDDLEVTTWVAHAALTIDDPLVRAAIDRAFDRGGIWPEILGREEAEHARGAEEPWFHWQAARDPMAHFDETSLARLRAANADQADRLDEAGGAPGWPGMPHHTASPPGRSGAATKPARGQGGKRKRQAARKARRKNRR